MFFSILTYIFATVQPKTLHDAAKSQASIL